METVREVGEKECDRAKRDALEKDGDLKEEEEKRDQQMTRIGCFCFSGVSVTISS